MFFPLLNLFWHQIHAHIIRSPTAIATKLNNEETPIALALAVVTWAVPADDVADDPELEELEDPELDPDPELETGGCPVVTVVLLPDEEEEEEEEDELEDDDELDEEEIVAGRRFSVVTFLEANW